MPAIETIGLTKDYKVGFWRKRAKRALDSMSLQVEEGEIFGLLGPNGAGKTTTLKLLFRLVFPTAGTARILGKELDAPSLRARVGYLPENPYFYDHLTPTEFLDYMAALFGLSARERRSRVGGILERVGLTESRDVPLRKFSKGMTQRVGIAQALINDPEVVFLDEPMSGLDPLGRREVRDLILRLKELKKTVFFSTHILSDAEALCDRVAILSHGRLQGCGELRKILRLEAAATELVLEDPSAELLTELAPYATSVIRTGERVRLQIAQESELPEVFASAVRRGAKILSVNPVKMSLEDYFLAKIAAPTEAARDEEVILPSPRSRS